MLLNLMLRRSRSEKNAPIAHGIYVNSAHSKAHELLPAQHNILLQNVGWQVEYKYLLSRPVSSEKVKNIRQQRNPTEKLNLQPILQRPNNEGQVIGSSYSSTQQK